MTNKAFLCSLNENDRTLVLRLEDGSQQTYSLGEKVKANFAKFNIGKDVSVGFFKEDPSIVNYISAYSDNPTPIPKPYQNTGFKPASAPVDWVDKGNDIRSQLLVKISINLINTHNMYCVNKPCVDRMFEPTQQNIKTLALELHKTIHEVKRSITDGPSKDPLSTQQF